MDMSENFDYIQTLIYEAEHSTATIDEAYDTVSKWLTDFDSI